MVVNYAKNEDAAHEAGAAIRAAFGEAIALRADASIRAEVEQLFAAAHEAYGRVDILVNNAGIAKFLPINEIDEDIGSIFAQTSLPNGSVYSATKATLDAITRKPHWRAHARSKDAENRYGEEEHR